MSYYVTVSQIDCGAAVTDGENTASHGDKYMLHLKVQYFILVVGVCDSIVQFNTEFLFFSSKRSQTFKC